MGNREKVLGKYSKVWYNYNMKSKNQKLPTTMKENTGKVLIDLGKLMFGSFILGGVLRGEVPQFLILVSGFIGAITFITLGLILTNKYKEKE